MGFTAVVSRCRCIGGVLGTPRSLVGRSHFSGSNIRYVAGAFYWTEGLWLLCESVEVSVVADGDLLEVHSIQPSLEDRVVADRKLQ